MNIYLLIGCMALVSAPSRLLPLWLFHGKKFHPILEKWLKFVPASVIAAVLAPSIFLQDGKIDLSFSNLYFWVAIPTFIVAWFTRNLLITITFGMVTLSALRFYLGA